MANSMRRSNAILRLQDGERWIEDKEELKSHVVGFYQQLFTEDVKDWRPSWNDDNLPKLSREQQDSLTRRISEEEVKQAIFQMEGDKAPGPDGFPPLFFQSFWEVVKSDTLRMVQCCLETSHGCKALNKAFILLLPKKSGAEKLADFRPISLLNTAYKILAKVLATRLSGVLRSLIEEEQSTFIPRRAIQENFLITQETLDSQLNSGFKGAL